MLKNMKIGNKLALIMIIFSLVITAFLSTSFYLQFEEALMERVFLQLSSVKQLKMNKISAEIEEKIHAFDELDSSEFELLFMTPNIPDSLGENDLSTLETKENPTLVDLTAQNPDGGIAVAFIDKQANGYKIGLTTLPEVQDILLERTGLGETGESYLVDNKFQLITKSRFVNNHWPILVETKGVNEAFDGRPGADIFMDYRNIRVLGAYEEIDYHGLNWVILSEINMSEALSPLFALRTNLIITLLVIMTFILVMSYFISKLVTQPIMNMKNQLIDMSKGKFDPDESNSSRSDEIGEMFTALNRLISALNETILFADEIGSGNFNASYVMLGIEDRLGSALMRMKNRLRNFQETEKRLLRENQKSIISGEENERSRLSKELHDGIGPLLTTLRIKLQSSELQSEDKAHLLGQIDDTIREIRRMSNNLMPSVLEDFGAGEAVKNLVHGVQEHSGVKVTYKNDMHSHSGIDPNIHLTIYRVTQEAINNSLKHANCSEIKISLSEFPDYVSLFYTDNGRGFNANIRQSGNGINNIMERVKLVNGTVDIESELGAGAKIEVEIPLN